MDAEFGSSGSKLFGYSGGLRKRIAFELLYHRFESIYFS